jgi:glycerol-3-phosphate cytidylyltransferase
VISNQIKEKQEVEKEKQYNIGYIAGVFDLFHIGHLNMLKKAKEYCNYLIVGVVTDERTKRMKGSKPFIPFEERAEIVRSCRYVDQVIEIPDNYGNSRDVYRLFHFDCQFSGSDYENHPGWQEEKEFLEKHGADLVFFPYTEHTSSTKIKELIRQKLV